MKKYITNNINTYQEIRESVKGDIKGFFIGGILAPISLFLGMLTMGVLILIAFGKIDYWGTTGKVLVGFGVPIIIILCAFKTPIGNIIFTIWSFILYCVLILLPFCAVIYFMGFKPVFQYLGL